MSNSRPAHAGARARGIGGRRHAEAVLGEIAAEEVADFLIVVDDEHVRRVVGERALRCDLRGLHAWPSVLVFRSSAQPPAARAGMQLNQRLDAGPIGLRNHGKKEAAR